jgi:hypothetical protein
MISVFFREAGWVVDATARSITMASTICSHLRVSAFICVHLRQKKPLVVLRPCGRFRYPLLAVSAPLTVIIWYNMFHETVGKTGV